LSESETAARRRMTRPWETRASVISLCVLGAFLLFVQVPADAAQTAGLSTTSLRLGEPLRAKFALPQQELGECVQAEVTYGEEPVDAKLVRASVSGRRPNHFIRVETDVAINEPFVVVTVRTGCNAPRIRVLTLLAAPADEPAFAPGARSAKRPQARSERPVGQARLTLAPQVQATASIRPAVFQPTEQSVDAFSPLDRLEANLALLQDRERRRKLDIAELRNELIAVGSWPASAWIGASVVLILSAASVAAVLLVPLVRPRRRSIGWSPMMPTSSRSIRSSPRVVRARQRGLPKSAGPQPAVARGGGESQSVEHLLAARLRELDASLGEEPARTDTASSGLAPAAMEHAPETSSGASTRPSSFEFGPRLGFDIDLDDIEREVRPAP